MVFTWLQSHQLSRFIVKITAAFEAVGHVRVYAFNKGEVLF